MSTPALRTLKTILLTAVTLVLPLAGSGCSDPNEPEPVTTIHALPRDLTAAERELIAAGETFAFDFLAEVAATEDAGANVFVSPLSASMALGMALAGAENDTYIDDARCAWSGGNDARTDRPGLRDPDRAAHEPGPECSHGDRKLRVVANRVRSPRRPTSRTSRHTSTPGFQRLISTTRRRPTRSMPGCPTRRTD